MLTAVLLIISGIGLPVSAFAQDKEPPLPKNTIDCKQFKKTGAKQWIEVGTAVFDLGVIDDIHLTDQPVTPGYFKFGGIDLYPVLERKCGAPATTAASTQSPAMTADAPQLPPTTAAPTESPAAITAAQPPAANAGAVVKEELEPSQDEPKMAQGQDQTSGDQGAPPISESGSAPLEGQAEKGPCSARKLVYTANGVVESGAAPSMIEIVFDSKYKEGLETAANAEFLIRESSNNQIEWTYKGRFLQRDNPSRFEFALFQPRRRRPVFLEPHYIKPNRDGMGEPILYIAGLRKLLASKRNGRALKIEGKRPPEILPEVFYLDRCE